MNGTARKPRAPMETIQANVVIGASAGIPSLLCHFGAEKE